jgi:hypothetical protein
VAAGRHDRIAPAYQFHEVHETEVRAGRGATYDAVKQTTAGEILFFRTLTWVRRFGRPGPEGILNPPAGQPLLEVAVRTGFLLLAEDPGREIVIGRLVAAPPQHGRIRTPEEFAALNSPGYAKATLNFAVDEIRPGVSRVRTETRVYATDPRTQRRFAWYWRLIYPGSALIRRMWLRAIRLRAEGTRRQP